MEFLPYGVWLCRDGREVLFTVEHTPLLKRHDGCVKETDPSGWVEHVVSEITLYDSWSSPRRNERTKAKLRYMLREWLAQARARGA